MKNVRILKLGILVTGLLFIQFAAHARAVPNPFKSCTANLSDGNAEMTFTGTHVQVIAYDPRSGAAQGQAIYKIVNSSNVGSTFHLESQIGSNFWQMIAQQKALVLNINTLNNLGTGEMTVYADGAIKKRISFSINCKK